jgi:predicted GNAT superfamily acetyltransferase
MTGAPPLLTHGDVTAERAMLLARSAAERAGVTTGELHGAAAMRDAATLVAEVWQTGDDHSQLDSSLLCALEHTGNFVGGAYADGRLLAMSVGFLASPPGRVLHSHITCAAGDRQGRGLGFALKLYQRAWARARGIETVTWTFDPLVRRNAYFNLVKLGARAVEYLPDFYGAMTDGVNAGDESDRLLVHWPLDAEDVRTAVEGRPVPGDAEPAGGTVLLEEDRAGAPQRRDGTGARLACGVPDDIVRLRATAPELALLWRRALRTALQDALAAGYRVTGFTRSGYYLLSAVPAPGGTAAAGW